MLDTERQTPQNLTINSQVSYYSREYLDYARVLKHIKELLRIKKYRLLEDALIDITSELKTLYPEATKIYLSIEKDDVFDDCSVGVELTKNYDILM